MSQCCGEGKGGNGGEREERRGWWGKEGKRRGALGKRGWLWGSGRLSLRQPVAVPRSIGHTALAGAVSDWVSPSSRAQTRPRPCLTRISASRPLWLAAAATAQAGLAAVWWGRRVDGLGSARGRVTADRRGGGGGPAQVAQRVRVAASCARVRLPLRTYRPAFQPLSSQRLPLAPPALIQPDGPKLQPLRRNAR